MIISAIWINCSVVHHGDEANINTHIDRLVQERRNSSALATELRLSCANPSNIDRLVQEGRNYSALAMELRLSCANPSILNANTNTLD